MTSFLPRVSVSTLLLGLVASQLSAQVQFNRTFMPTPGTIAPFAQFGFGVLSADFDKDGFDDLLCAEPRSSFGGLVSAGNFWILYGPTFTRSLRIEVDKPDPNEELGASRASVGDVNGDGEWDILLPAPLWPVGTVGPPPAGIGRAHLLFGPDFVEQILFEDPEPTADGTGMFGWSNLLADVDGDGLDDVLISAPGLTTWGPTEPGRVWMWNATDLRNPIQVPNPFLGSPLDGFGTHIQVADIDADGPKELLISAPWVADPGPPFRRGAIAVLSYPELSLVRVIRASGPFMLYFGTTFDVGEVNGDKHLDFVVSAPQAAVGQPLTGAVVVLPGPDYDTTTHTLISPINPDVYFFGREMSVDDVNLDGHPDVLVGDDLAFVNNGIRIFYGPDFAAPQSLGLSPYDNAGLGEWFTVGDFDGDSRPDVAAYEHGSPVEYGLMTVYDVRTLVTKTKTISQATGGRARFDLDMGELHGHRNYIGVIGHSGSLPGVTLTGAHPVYVPINPDGLTQLGLTTLNGPVLRNFKGLLDHRGRTTMVLNLPPAAHLLKPQDRIVVAVVLLDEDGLLLTGSSAEIVTIVP